MNREQPRQDRDDGRDAEEQAAALFEAALRSFRSGRLAEAEAACREALGVRPGYADGLHLLGLIHAQNGELDFAIETIAQAIRIDQRNSDYFFNLATLLAKAGRLEEALKSCDLALRLKPDFARAWIKLGDLLRQQRRGEEALLAYRRASSLDPSDAEAAEKAAKLLWEQGRLEEAAAAYRDVLDRHPEHYDASNDLGGVLAELGRAEEAVASFRKAVALRPEAPAALNNLALALQSLKRFDEAAALIERAIALSPGLAALYGTRGNLFKAQNRFEAALADYDRAIALDPTYVEAHSNRGNCLDDLARPEEALASYRRALALQPERADAHWNLAVNRLRAGDLPAGFVEAEWLWKTASMRPRLRAFDKPCWLGTEAIEGKVLLLHNEQGFGDAIQFCRYVPMLAARGATVWLEVAAPLTRLLAGLAGVNSVVAKGEPLPDFDFHCQLSSLPLAFDTTLATIPSSVPYLSAPPGARDWSPWLGARTRPRIGLVWSGNPGHRNDHNRSIALETLLPLLDLDAQFVSLQKDAREDDLRVLRSRADMLDAAAGLASFADTAALIGALDLVISVDTSVAHLAGALGKPVFILLPHVADWRWLTERADSPWYPTARLFRQDATRRWEPVVAEARAALQRRLARLNDRDPAGWSAPTT